MSHRFRVLLVTAAMSFVACGGSVDPAGAATCAELQDQAIPLMQMLLDYAEDIPLEDLVENDPGDVLVEHDPERWQEIDEVSIEWEDRRRELGCLFQIDDAVADRRDDLRIETRSSEYLLELFLGEA